MTRHIADKQHETGAGRVQNFTRQERESGTHPAVVSLLARPRKVDDQGGRRISEFVRIERGRLT
ncbi:MAG TPA: hypothetical protein VNQ78_14235 [Paracoccus sp. (in: a-proteobacteria)]|uniref:hypothetical protein n=1 Tax=Paracoccus sp. TaxID=267 RepID=UPI002B966FCA|nr:hypothetical protein [Paracoccus sp. (in: a-proteobacteria)]HWL57818.1 hypothetical protein [Paracoccus sp. (in: a-proteobacteria)]